MEDERTRASLWGSTEEDETELRGLAKADESIIHDGSFIFIGKAKYQIHTKRKKHEDVLSLSLS